MASEFIHAKSIGPFLKDTHRLIEECSHILKFLSDPRGVSKLEVIERVQTFFNSFHSLKGTLSMAVGSNELIEKMNGLESKLACQSAAASARDLSWIRVAHDCLIKARQSLDQIEGQIGPQRQLPLGLLVRLSPGDFRWIGLDQVLQVVSPEDYLDKLFYCFKGAWIPIFKSKKTQNGRNRVVLGADFGKFLLEVESIEGIFLRNQVDLNRAQEVAHCELLLKELSKQSA